MIYIYIYYNISNWIIGHIHIFIYNYIFTYSKFNVDLY